MTFYPIVYIHYVMHMQINSSLDKNWGIDTKSISTFTATSWSREFDKNFLCSMLCWWMGILIYRLHSRYQNVVELQLSAKEGGVTIELKLVRYWQYIHYTLNFIFYKSEAIDTLHELYLHFSYELALETSAKHSSIKSLRVHDLCHAHSLASLQWSGPSDQWTLLPTENCLQCQKWSP